VGDLAAELRKIRDEYGDLRRRTIVNVARDPDHPLHSRFEWDDRVAGDRYRLVQAGELIRSVTVKYTDRGGEAREIHEWHSVVRDGSRAYEPVDEIAEDPVTMKILLREMQRDWRALRTRYGHLKEFWEMIQSGLDPQIE
jgi:hypothetical protein